jgi:hypothetical protein
VSTTTPSTGATPTGTSFSGTAHPSCSRSSSEPRATASASSSSTSAPAVLHVPRQAPEARVPGRHRGRQEHLSRCAP